MKKLMFPLLIVLLLVPNFVLAQDAEAGNKSARILHKKIADSLFVLTHNNTNSVLYIDKDYALIVDTQTSAAGPDLLQYASRLSPLQPIKFVLNTHYHKDHTGGNKFFYESGATILANLGTHTNLLTSINEAQIKTLNQERTELIAQVKAEGNSERGQKLSRLLEKNVFENLEQDLEYSVLTYTGGLNWELSGESIEVKTILKSHTSEDTYVYFKNKNVLVTGDLFFSKAYPFIDLAYGGGIDGFMKSLDALLLSCDDDTMIVPGHGPIASKNDLAQYKRMIEYIYKGVSMDYLLNKSLSEVKSNKAITAQFDAQGFGKGYVSASQFIEMLYAEADKKYSKRQK